MRFLEYPDRPNVLYAVMQWLHALLNVIGKETSHELEATGTLMSAKHGRMAWMRIIRRFKGTLIVLGFNLMLIGILLVGALAGPPGKINTIAIPTSRTPAAEITRFRESLVAKVVYGERVLWSSAIRQPASTWSNLFSILLGLGLLLYPGGYGRCRPTAGKSDESPHLLRDLLRFPAQFPWEREHVLPWMDD